MTTRLPTRASRLRGRDAAILLTARSIPLLALAAFAASCGSGVGSATASDCDRVAARSGSDSNPGTLARPFKTVQRLADSLRPGEVGCARAGTYSERQPGDYVLKLNHAGRAGAPITIRSYPGERALLKGTVFVPRQSPHVTLSALDIDGRAPWIKGDPVTLHVMAANTTLEQSDVTNRGLKSCVLLGSNRGWGKATRAIISHNVFHGCGDRRHGMLDHAIYSENAQDVEIVSNVFWGNAAWAVHLYPNSRRVRVRGNVMDSNGGGVIFAGEGKLASSDNVVEHNVISNPRSDLTVGTYWGGKVGRGNVARDNCVWDSGDAGVSHGRGFLASDNLVAQPLFVDRDVGDYRLQASSPCRDTLAAVSSTPGPTEAVAAARTRSARAQRPRAASSRS